MYGGCLFSTARLISIIKKEKPDIVHLHCINGYFVNIYRLVTWLKTNKIKTVVTLHAEFLFTANCGYAFECNKWMTGCGNCPKRKEETKSYIIDGTKKSWKMMKKAFDNFSDNCCITSVSPWLMNRAKQAPILQNLQHETVLNGIDTDIFHPYTDSELRSQYGINSKPLIVHVNPSFSLDKNHIKGGYFVVELAKKMPDVIFAIIGCSSDIKGLPNNVINVGRIEDQHKLAEWYSVADLTLLTSRRETFSMITAESMCCGTPVVGFMAGGPESIAIEEYSKFVEYGNVDSLADAAYSMINNPIKLDTVFASQKYSKARMTDEYISIYKRIL
jgi:glycosyltransferase involved in cell wall biosynthesis